MASTVRMKMVGVGLLIGGILVGATGAEAVRALKKPSFVDTGIFTVQSGEEGRFFVALHDRENAAPVSVLLQILDEDGTVVVQSNATLGGGQSTSLAVGKRGRFRGHARILDGPRVLFSDRRVTGSAEVSHDLNLIIRPVCPIGAIDDSQGVGRPG